MKTSQVGIDLIKSFEGCRLVAYKPVPTEVYWTIGWGRYGQDVKEGMVITQARADEMLLEDVYAKAEQYVSNPRYCPITDELNQNQFDALVSFCYNCGGGNLRDLCSGRTIDQVATHIADYNKSSGTVLAGLVRRRQAETELFTKEDEAMLAAITQLQGQVQTLLATSDAHVKRISELEGKMSMPTPDWAKEAVSAAVKAKLIDTPDGGSYDFYRLVTILHRNKLI